MSRQKYNEEIICPHCDYKNEDSYEYFNYRACDGDTKQIECGQCEKSFEVEVHISWKYSSKITECKYHFLEVTVELDDFILFECSKCFEEFYDHHLPSGCYPKIKEGGFEFIGKAKELMEKRVVFS